MIVLWVCEGKNELRPTTKAKTTTECQKSFANFTNSFEEFAVEQQRQTKGVFFQISTKPQMEEKEQKFKGLGTFSCQKGTHTPYF